MRKNTTIPIESFDPRLKELLLRGAIERIEIPCDSFRQRTALRNQLFDYRAAARRASFSDAAALYRAKISFEQREDAPFLLVIAPRGSEFDSALSRATSARATPILAQESATDILDSIPVTPTEDEPQ